MLRLVLTPWLSVALLGFLSHFSHFSPSLPPCTVALPNLPLRPGSLIPLDTADDPHSLSRGAGGRGNPEHLGHPSRGARQGPGSFLSEPLSSVMPHVTCGMHCRACVVPTFLPSAHRCFQDSAAAKISRALLRNLLEGPRGSPLLTSRRDTSTSPACCLSCLFPFRASQKKVPTNPHKSPQHPALSQTRHPRITEDYAPKFLAMQFPTSYHSTYTKKYV